MSNTPLVTEEMLDAAAKALLAFKEEDDTATRFTKIYTAMHSARETDEGVVERCAKALKPFADRVFNDNGSLTVNTEGFKGNEIEDAYFAYHAAITAMESHP